MANNWPLYIQYEDVEDGTHLFCYCLVVACFWQQVAACSFYILFPINIIWGCSDKILNIVLIEKKSNTNDLSFSVSFLRHYYKIETILKAAHEREMGVYNMGKIYWMIIFFNSLSEADFTYLLYLHMYFFIISFYITKFSLNNWTWVDTILNITANMMYICESV